MQSKSVLAILLAALAVCPASSLRARGANGARLQPQVVAHTLFMMEDEWRNQAALFAECNATMGSLAQPCSAASKAFEKSCTTVVKAVNQASSGDRTAVTEYMGDICGQAELEGWRKQRCQSLASTISGAMSADNYENREELDVHSVCQNYWSSFSAAERERMSKERAEAEAQRVAREAEEKKLAAEHAEAAKKAAAEAATKAAEAAKKAAEESAKHKVEEEAKHKVEAAKKAAEEVSEAKRKAIEEKEKAEKEAAELQAKEELAHKMAEEAKKKMEEATAAAAEAHRKSQAVAANVLAKAATETVNKNASHTVNATKVVKK